MPTGPGRILSGVVFCCYSPMKAPIFRPGEFQDVPVLARFAMSKVGKLCYRSWFLSCRFQTCPLPPPVVAGLMPQATRQNLQVRSCLRKHSASDPWLRCRRGIPQTLKTLSRAQELTKRIANAKSAKHRVEPITTHFFCLCEYIDVLNTTPGKHHTKKVLDSFGLQNSASGQRGV